MNKHAKWNAHESKDVNSSLRTLYRAFSSSLHALSSSRYRALSAAAAAAARRDGVAWPVADQMKGGLCRLIVAPDERRRGRLHLCLSAL